MALYFLPFFNPYFSITYAICVSSSYTALSGSVPSRSTSGIFNLDSPCWRCRMSFSAAKLNQCNASTLIVVGKILDALLEYQHTLNTEQNAQPPDEDTGSKPE